MKFGIYPNLGKKDLKMALERLTALLRDKNIDYSLPLSMKKGLMDMGFTEDTYETDESMGKRDFILSVGGDGSFLGACPRIQGLSCSHGGAPSGRFRLFKFHDLKGYGKKGGPDSVGRLSGRASPLSFRCFDSWGWEKRETAHRAE